MRNFKLRINAIIITVIAFTFVYTTFLAHAQSTLTSSAILVASSIENTSSSSATSELPHYVRPTDYDGFNIMLQNSSVEKSKVYSCGFYLNISCTESTSTTFLSNNISKFNFSKSLFHNSGDWGVGLNKVESVSAATSTSDTAQFIATTTKYKVSLLTKVNDSVSAASTNIVLDKNPNRILLSDNKIAIFISESRLAEVYDLSNGRHINSIMLFDQPLDPKDDLSYVYFASISRHGKYFAWYIPFSSSRSYITYGFTEVSTGKSIIRKEEVQFDRVARSGNIFDFSNDEKTGYFISATSGYNVIWNIDLSESFSASKEVSGQLFSKKYTVTNFLINAGSMYFVANRENPNLFGLYEYNLSTSKLKKLNEYPVSYVDNIKYYKNKIFYNYVVKDKGLSMASYDIYTNKNSYFPIELDTRSKIDTSKYKYVKNAKDAIVLGVPGITSTTSDSLLVFLHGGPYNQIYDGYHPTLTYGIFDWLLEAARKNGAYVAKLDYPGSFGYGVDYTNSLLGGIGSVDIESLHNSIEKIKLANKSIKKVYLVGISYGGYMAVKDYTTNPSSYEEVFALAPVTDWHSEYETGTYSFFNSHFGIFGTSTPTTTPEILALYDKADLLKNIPSLPATTTLTIYKGTKDYAVDFRETQAFDSIMKENGKSYTYNVFDGQPHVFNKRSIWTKVCSDIVSKFGNGKVDGCKLD